MKRVIACIASLFLVFSLLAACSPSPSGSTPASSQPSQSPAPGESQQPSEVNTDPLGKYDETVTVNMGRNFFIDPKFAPGQNYENNVWITEYEEVLGIKINNVWTAEGVEDYREKLNMQILAKDLPDIFECEAAQYLLLAENGLIESLDAAFDTYASEQLKSYMDDLTREMSSYDGSLLGIAKNNVGRGNFHYIWLRDDWRVQLGMDVPKTMDDLYALAKAFVENGATLNPDAKVYGLGISNEVWEGYWGTYGFFHGFGAYPQMWVEKDGAIEYGGIQPEMKTALAELRKYFEEGLIDPEYIAKGSWGVYEDSLKGMNGIMYGQMWCGTWPLPDHYKLGQDWTGYTIPMNPESKGVASEIKAPDLYVVRKGYENPEALIKMTNLILERCFSGNYNLNKYKGDGVYDYMGLAPVYTTLGPGDRNESDSLLVTEAIDKGDIGYAVSSAEAVDYFKKIQPYLEGKDRGAVKIFEEDGADARDAFATGQWMYKYFYGPNSVQQTKIRWTTDDMWFTSAFYGANTETMQTNWSQLRDAECKMIIDIVSGQQPLDYFDTFINDWKNLGGAQITAEVNDWYETVK